MPVNLSRRMHPRSRCLTVSCSSEVLGEKRGWSGPSGRADRLGLGKVAGRLWRVLFLAFAASCADGTTEPDPDPPLTPTLASVTVTPSATGLGALGDTVRLVAQVRDGSGAVLAGAGVSWLSLDGAVVSVSGEGLVTAAGNGTARVSATASSGAVSGTATVTVRQVAAAVTVGPDSMRLLTGRVDSVTASAEDANGNAVRLGELAGAAFTWETTDGEVATVSAEGESAGRVNSGGGGGGAHYGIVRWRGGLGVGGGGGAGGDGGGGGPGLGRVRRVGRHGAGGSQGPRPSG